MEIFRKIKDTFELVRFSHTIFALPFALASMLVAADGFPTPRTFLLIIGCMVLARTSAMSFNRYADVDIDAANPRTQDRPIQRGALSKRYALVLSITSGAAFVVLTWFLNFLSFVLAPAALIVIWLYSLTKRYTNYTQLFLGLALGISPVGAWIAVKGSIDWPPILLGTAVLFWVAGFDIFYSIKDESFDKRAGLKSLVTRFGVPRALSLARLFHLFTSLLLVSLVFFVPSPAIYLVTSGLVTGLLVYEHTLVSPGDLSRINQAFFTLNGWVGIVYLLGTAAAVLLV